LTTALPRGSTGWCPSPALVACHSPALHWWPVTLQPEHWWPAAAQRCWPVAWKCSTVQPQHACLTQLQAASMHTEAERSLGRTHPRDCQQMSVWGGAGLQRRCTTARQHRSTTASRNHSAHLCDLGGRGRPWAAAHHSTTNTLMPYRGTVSRGHGRAARADTSSNEASLGAGALPAPCLIRCLSGAFAPDVTSHGPASQATCVRM
jgi:hypothetical protein